MSTALRSAADGLRAQVDETCRIGTRANAEARAAIETMRPLVQRLGDKVPPATAARLEAMLTTMTLRSGEMDAALRRMRQTGDAAVDAIVRVPDAVDGVERSNANLKEAVERLSAFVAELHAQTASASASKPGDAPP